MKLLINDIGYNFKDEKLLKTALTHSSFANEHNCKSYERLEFLGDSILSFVISSSIYKNFPDLPEGELSKLRASIVCERSLEECSKKLNVGKYLILSKGEETTGGRERASILADVFEAILGAIFLDGGIEPARDFINKYLSDAVIESHSGKGVFKDYKTVLQEIVQQNEGSVEYFEVKEEGPEHNKIFTVGIKYMGSDLSYGSGRNKKEAQQNAAKEAIKKLQFNND